MTILYVRVFVAYLVFFLFIFYQQLGIGGFLRGVIWGGTLGIPLALACLDWISSFSAVAIGVRLVLAILISCIFLAVISYFGSLGLCVLLPLAAAALSSSIYSKNNEKS